MYQTRTKNLNLKRRRPVPHTSSAYSSCVVSDAPIMRSHRCITGGANFANPMPKACVRAFVRACVRACIPLVTHEDGRQNARVQHQ